MNLFSNLTICILTFRRAKFVIRQIEYWRNSGIHLCIVDGSEEPIANPADYTIGSLRYIHAPLSIHERLLIAKDAVRTKFSALLADDDMFTKSGTHLCLEFLEKNREYSCVSGRMSSFRFASNNWPEFAIAYHGAEGYEITSDNPKDRLISHFSNYLPTMYYAICRTEPWKRAIELSCTDPCDFWGQTEVQVQMALAVSGKSRILDFPFWLRSREAPSLGNANSKEIGLNINMPFNVFWTDPKNKVDVEHFVSNSTKLLAIYFNGNECHARAAIIEGCCRLAKQFAHSFKLKQQVKNYFIVVKSIPILSTFWNLYRRLRSQYKSNLLDVFPDIDVDVKGDIKKDLLSTAEFLSDWKNNCER